MHRTAVLAAVLSLPPMLVACTSAPPDGADAAAALDAAVLVAATGCGTAAVSGGGSFVDDDLVLTVAHVVAGSSSVRVTTVDGRSVDARVMAIDRRKDLAVLRADGGTSHLPFGDLRPGVDGVFVMWRDGSAVTERFHGEGAVDIHTDDIDDDGPGRRRGYVVEADITEGDSGTVLVSSGRAVGVVFARSAEHHDRAWAVDVDEAAALLATAHAATTPASTGACAHGPDGDADRDDP